MWKTEHIEEEKYKTILVVEEYKQKKNWDQYLPFVRMKLLDCSYFN